MSKFTTYIIAAILLMGFAGCGGEDTSNIGNDATDSPPCDNMYRVRPDNYATKEQRSCTRDSECTEWKPSCRCFPYGVREDAVDQLPNEFICHASELDFCDANAPASYCGITHCVKGTCEFFVGDIPNPDRFTDELAVEEGVYPFYPQEN